MKRHCLPFIAAIATCLSTIATHAQSPATQPAASPIIVTATIEAMEASDLYPKTSGYLIEVNKDIGDHVKAGDVLAVIDQPELHKELAAAEANLAAKRELAKASEANVAQAQKTLDVTKSQLAGLQADLKFAQLTLKRQEDLFAGKAITDQQLDEARTKAETSKAQTDVGQAKIAAAEADVRSAEANRAVAEAQAKVAEAEVQRLQALIAYTKITAPFDGVVTRRLVNRGDLAQPTARSQPLFTVQRIDQVRVFCDVPESTAARVNAGCPAAVKIYGLDGKVIEGKVTRIAFAMNPETRTMRAEVDLPNPGESLRPGMYAQVTLTPAAAQPVVGR